MSKEHACTECPVLIQKKCSHFIESTGKPPCNTPELLSFDTTTEVLNALLDPDEKKNVDIYREMLARDLMQGSLTTQTQAFHALHEELGMSMAEIANYTQELWKKDHIWD